MKKTILISILSLSMAMQAMAWGSKGHDIVAYIAECNLTSKAAKQATAVLDGHSLVYYSSWMDGLRSKPEYQYANTWHYRNVDEGYTPETMPREPKGDVVTAVESLTADLKAGGLTPEQEKVKLMMLIHTVGDLHQPMHGGRKSDLGGNRVSVEFFGRKTSLHSMWDTALLDFAHKWSYTEWQQQLDRVSKSEYKEIVNSTPEQWYEETFENASDVYANTPDGSSLSYDYIERYAPMLEESLLRAGLRLAATLNEIYD